MSGHAASTRTSSESQRPPDSSSLSTMSDASTLVTNSTPTNDDQQYECTGDNAASRRFDPTSPQDQCRAYGSQSRIIRFLLATWLGNAIALIASVIAIITLILTAYSSILQIMALKWGMQNEALQSCLAAYPISRLSAFCNVTISNGVIEPPSGIRRHRDSAIMYGGPENYTDAMHDELDDWDIVIAKESIYAAGLTNYEADDNEGISRVGALAVIITTFAGLVAIYVVVSRRKRPCGHLASARMNRTPES